MSARHGRIFVSYSHRGTGPHWKAALQRALEFFEKHELLDVWQDGRIRISAFWDDDIRAAIDRAGIAIVLLTPEALDPRSSTDPNYILDTEFPLLRERQKAGVLTVFPVVCEECPWRDHDWLRATQAPNGSQPLALLSHADQEQTFRSLGVAVAEEISRLALTESLPRENTPATRCSLDAFPQGHGGRDGLLIGREAELALLDLALAQPTTSIVSLVAWGGVGKSVLVQHWLRRLERAQWLNIERIFAWSFFSQGTQEDRQASEDPFLMQALAWFEVPCDPALSPWDKGRLLADAVRRQRTLLILDGVEPLQYPPGPMGGQLRAPGLQSLLLQLARTSGEAKGLCVVTTREPLVDLLPYQRRAGMTGEAVLRVDLGNLTDRAGAVLLHQLGVKRSGASEIALTDQELLQASREVGGHALTLRLLGKFLFRGHGGDIRQRDLVQFEEADRTLQGGTTFRMLAAFEEWFSRGKLLGSLQVAILRMLGLFDRPAETDDLAVLRTAPAIGGITEPCFHITSRFWGWIQKHDPLPDEDWNTAVSFLTDFGLIQPLADEQQRVSAIDCHPLVREYFGSRLRANSVASSQTAHRRISQTLLDRVPETDSPTSTQLETLYHAVSQGCLAGEIERTLDDVYTRRILQFDRHYSLRQFGMFGSDLKALASFFSRPWIEVDSGLPPGAKSFVLNEAGTRLRAVGRFSEAIEPLSASIRIDLTHQEWRSAAITCCNLSDTYRALGDLASAGSVAKRAVEYVNRCEVDRHIGVYRQSNSFVMVMCAFPRHANIHALTGDFRTSQVMFQGADDLQRKYQPEYPLLYSDVGAMYLDLLLVRSERLAWQKILGVEVIDRLEENDLSVLARVARLKDLSEVDDGLLTRGLDDLNLVRAELYGRVIENRPLSSIHEPMERCLDSLRRAGMIEFVPPALLTRSVIRFLSGLRTGTQGSQADLDEAWDIAIRGSMKLHMADIHLHRARLFYRETRYPWKSPQVDLDAAATLIHECGYHRHNEELSDARSMILRVC